MKYGLITPNSFRERAIPKSILPRCSFRQDFVISSDEPQILTHMITPFIWLPVSESGSEVRDSMFENRGHMNILEIPILESLHLEDYWELRVHISQADDPVHEYS